MTPEEKYLFDLNGYLVLRGVLSPDMRQRLNETIDYLETLDDESDNSSSELKENIATRIMSTLRRALRQKMAWGIMTVRCFAMAVPLKSSLTCPRPYTILKR